MSASYFRFSPDGMGAGAGSFFGFSFEFTFGSCPFAPPLVILLSYAEKTFGECLILYA